MYVRLEKSWDLKSCKQEPGESLWDYIRRFSRQCNSLPDIVDTDVIGAFLTGTTCKSLVHKLGCRKLRTTCELLDIATNHASIEEAVGAIFTDGRTMGKAKWMEEDEGPTIVHDRRLNPDLPRGTVNLIGAELEIDDPRPRTNRTPQSLHHCSVGKHPCHTNDLATKAYPCKRNQEHKQEQEMQSNRLDYQVESHKLMNGDTVRGQIEPKQNLKP
jgi:hypothetical protein